MALFKYINICSWLVFTFGSTTKLNCLASLSFVSYLFDFADERVGKFVPGLLSILKAIIVFRNAILNVRKQKVETSTQEYVGYVFKVIMLQHVD